MSIFELDIKGKTYEVEAPDMDTAIQAVQGSSSPTPESKTIEGFAGNAAESGKSYVKNTVSGLLHPIQTGKGLLNLFGGGLQKLGVLSPAGMVLKHLPGAEERDILADIVGEDYKNRYGSLEKLGNTLYKDPVNVLGDASIVLGGVGGILSKAGKVGTLGKIASVGQKISNAGAAIDPIQAAVKGVSAVAGAGKIAAKIGDAVDFNVDIFPKEAAEASNLDSMIKLTVDKALRPSVVGKGNSTQVNNYYKDANTAIKTIVANKEGLGLVDKNGKARLPENLGETLDAVSTTKKTIYQLYDGMKQESGEMGSTIDLKDLAQTVLEGVSGKEVGVLHPEVQNYALQKAIALDEAGTFTPAEAQRAIENMNVSLKSFMKNPDYSHAKKVIVDAAIANNLREALDATITKDVGQGYQALRNKYKALKTIEKDLSSRTTVDARKSPKGFFDLSDIFTSGDIQKAIVSLDPAALAAGLAKRKALQMFKDANDPNIMIKKMFQRLDAKAVRGEVKTIQPKIDKFSQKSILDQLQEIDKNVR